VRKDCIKKFAENHRPRAEKTHCPRVGGYDLVHLAQRIESIVQFSDLFKKCCQSAAPVSVASGVFRALRSGVIAGFTNVAQACEPSVPATTNAGCSAGQSPMMRMAA
jgi:hypothetical protein